MTLASTFDRIVLGTVQIGIPYGKRSSAGLMSDDAAEELLDAAWALGIRNFDTAEAYGTAPARLSSWLRKSGHLQSAHVITKISATLSPSEIHRAATDALARFKGAKTVTLLSHGPIRGSNWSAMHAAAAADNARAGQSVYESDEVADALALDGVSVVQAPANVFDYRAMIAPAADSQEVHYRSIFLQGVLLDTPAIAEARVAGTGRLAEAVGQAAAVVGVPAAALLAAAILRASRPVDKIVLGADSPTDLKPVAIALEASEGCVDKFIIEISRVPVPARAVLDPRTWNKKQ